MRPWMILFGVAVFGTGCTHTALERRTVKQASTLTDLQYKQVLDNLAMFSRNPEAMPWHVKVKGGLIQIADQGSGMFGADIATAAGGEVTRLLPNASAQRGIVGQWELDPTIEAEELELLTLAYRKAVDPANQEVTTQVYKAIGELSIRFDILPKRETLRQLFTRLPAEAGVANRYAILKTTILQIHQEQIEIGSKLAEASAKKKAAQNAFDKLMEPIKKVLKEVEDAKKPAELEVAKKKLEELKKQSENELNKLRSDLAIAEEERGSLDREQKQLEARLGQLRSEEAGLREMIQLVREVAKPEKYIMTTGTGSQVYVASPATSRVPVGITPLDNILDRILRGTEKKEQPADQKALLLTAISFALDSYVPSPELREATQRNVGLVAQAEDKIRKLEDLAEKFNTPWLSCGGKHDAPKCACYVGRHRGCTGECYLWVMPDQLGTLREFTLIILALAPIEKQELFPSRSGAAFSPSFR